MDDFNPPSPILEESSDSSNSVVGDEPYSPPPITPGDPNNESEAEQGNISEQDSNSELDNPNFLRRMCAGFTNRIREKNEKISLLKKVLLNAQFQMCKREAAYRRKMRYLLLAHEKFYLENNLAYTIPKANGLMNGEINGDHSPDSPVENRKEVNPLNIFPKEIWTIVFENVQKSNDVYNIYKADLTFAKILKGTASQWLCEQIVPFIFNKLRLQDLLNCRLVCKRWRTAIDNFLEKYHAIQTEDDSSFKDFYLLKDVPLNVPTINYNPILDEYHFGIPPKEQPNEDDGDSPAESDAESVHSSRDSITFRLRDSRQLREEMRRHPRNPFLGRAVHLQENPADQNHPPDPWNTFILDATRMLQDFGRHFWYLRLDCALDSQDPLNFYKLTVKVMCMCPNLRSLSIVADLDWNVIGRSQLARYIDESLLYDRLPHFEKLSIITSNPNVFPIQDRFIDSYYAQLKYLSVHIWHHDSYTRHQWKMLRELEVNIPRTEEILQSLSQLQAPNLEKLSIVFDENGRHFPTMMELTNNFPNLSWVRIKLESGYCRKFSKQELSSLPGKHTSSANLTTLELICKCTEVISYDFLLFFPFLQKLIIGHEGRTQNDDETFSAQTLADVKKTEIVQITKYIRMPNIDTTVGSQLYRSNVWSILPYLKIIELCNATSFPEKRTVFTRQGQEDYLRRVAMNDKAVGID